MFQIIIKYLIIMPLYVAFRWIIPIALIIALPVFIAGMLVAMFGVLGHIFFLLLFFLGVLYYFKNVNNIFNPSLKKPGPKKKKQHVTPYGYRPGMIGSPYRRR